jgi:hypothetical protein
MAAMSRSAAAIAARIEDLPESSIRRKVLEGARRFKSSWVELGRLLHQVQREALWREWGFASFDAYCTKELFIRKATAEKLTRSYGFLERHEPGLATGEQDDRRRAASKPPPPFEVVEVLSRAEASGRLQPDRWEDLREEALGAPSVAALNRQLAERLGPAPKPPPADEAERVRRLAALARRLAQACAQDEAVPGAVAERARALADDLDELVDG